MIMYSDLQKIRTLFDDPTVAMLFPHHPEDYSPLLLGEADSDESNSEGSPSLDAFSSDQFRMYEFKVRRCSRGRAHDWTQCPYSHPGEKARRRDPRRFCYSGESCSEFRVAGLCRRGDACEFSHGVFETWLHPSRYRTQHCKDGAACRRRVCFFAHTPEQLRVLSGHDGSPRFQAIKSPLGSSPTSILMPPASNSPPLSPALRRPVQPSCIEELVASLREMQLSYSKSFPVSWGLGYGSPEVSGGATMFRSLPATPTVGSSSRRWEEDWCLGEEEKMERVESGKDLRAKMFEKLKEENMEKKGTESDTTVTTVTQDVGWVSELVR